MTVCIYIFYDINRERIEKVNEHGYKARIVLFMTVYINIYIYI